MSIFVATIGFTQTSAQHFFERLQKAGVRKLIDVRLNNTSQLAGFAKADDLAYFLRTTCGAGYEHQPLFAPAADRLRAYRKRETDWPTYEAAFLKLLAERRVEQRFTPQMFEGACLLCSEAHPHQCHRRLVCDYLNKEWGGVLNVRHL